jgi:hypothetical protein
MIGGTPLSQVRHDHRENERITAAPFDAAIEAHARAASRRSR